MFVLRISSDSSVSEHKTRGAGTHGAQELCMKLVAGRKTHKPRSQRAKKMVNMPKTTIPFRV